MIAVLKHELANYFRTLTAYVFGAFLLMFVGIGAMIYNIENAVANFEFVLSFVSLIFVVIVPTLTMRIIAEEKKQKTDQLLYSLPINTSEAVLGKFFALLLVYLVPLCIISVYPLIFARYGDVYLITSYGSILAFFIMGAALLSVGMFISSLTESQGFAAGIGIAIILFNYYSVPLAENFTSTAMGSAITLFIIALVIAFIFYYLTKNENIAYIIGIGLTALIAITFYIAPTNFEGLIPTVMTKLSLFERFYTFVNGVFDLSAIVYYITVIVFFLFLTIQSLEKRRYN